MTIRHMSAAGLTLAFAVTPLASRAHDLSCDESAGGHTAIVVRHFPAKIHFSLTVRNVHPTDASTVASVRAPLLERFGFRFAPAAPFTLPVGGQVVNAFDLVVKSREACEALASGTYAPSAMPAAYGASCDGHHHGDDGEDDACDDDQGEQDGDHHGDHGDGHGKDGYASGGHGDDGDHHGGGDEDGHACTAGLCHPGAFLDSVFVAAFDLGAAECRARIVCGDDKGEGHDDDHGDDHGHDGDDHDHGDHGHGDDHGHGHGDDGHAGYGH